MSLIEKDKSRRIYSTNFKRVIQKIVFMKKNNIFPFIFFLILTSLGYGQNLPSLLTERNINSTFSILAYDDKAKEWGIAVATNQI